MQLHYENAAMIADFGILVGRWCISDYIKDNLCDHCAINVQPSIFFPGSEFSKLSLIDSFKFHLGY